MNLKAETGVCENVNEQVKLVNQADFQLGLERQFKNFFSNRLWLGSYLKYVTRDLETFSEILKGINGPNSTRELKNTGRWVLTQIEYVIQKQLGHYTNYEEP